ncbi:uncharacterized protein LOC143836412 [Paroedura picta]|uniref:uncharacterized protein LOC143836412 n=1 Tax=Paroedura picta TaxID=143630 RepID=UPI004055CEDA
MIVRPRGERRGQRQAQLEEAMQKRRRSGRRPGPCLASALSPACARLAPRPAFLNGGFAAAATSRGRLNEPGGAEPGLARPSPKRRRRAGLPLPAGLRGCWAGGAPPTRKPPRAVDLSPGPASRASSGGRATTTEEALSLSPSISPLKLRTQEAELERQILIGRLHAMEGDSPSGTVTPCLKDKNLQKGNSKPTTTEGGKMCRKKSCQRIPNNCLDLLLCLLKLLHWLKSTGGVFHSTEGRIKDKACPKMNFAEMESLNVLLE